MERLYIVQKHVKAESAEQALQREKKIKPTEVFLSSTQNEAPNERPSAMGFEVSPPVDISDIDSHEW